MIQQILLCLFFLNFPKTILSKNSCPSSSCGTGIISFVSIRYPFKLQTDPLPKHCQDYINLRCNNQSRTLINLPSSGDFYVTYIDYYMQTIALSDPQNCLLGRLMTNFSLAPLEAFRYENYTYFLCPRKSVLYRFHVVECLSNSTNVTIAIAFSFSSEFMEEMYGCRDIGSSMIPVPRTTEYYDFYGDLHLTWNVPNCKDCEDYDAENFGDSPSKWAKILKSPIFIISAVLFAFFAVACYLRFTSLMATGADTNTTTENNPPPDSATAPPQTTGDTPSAPPGATNGTRGIDNSKLNSCTELVVLGEKQGTFLPISLTCSICLEEHHGEDQVRYLPHCGHYFHVECIDQWLQKNNTCPVCRTTLLE